MHAIFFEREHVGERAYFPAKRNATFLPQRGVADQLQYRCPLDDVNDEPGPSP